MPSISHKFRLCSVSGEVGYGEHENFSYVSKVHDGTRVVNIFGRKKTIYR